MAVPSEASEASLTFTLFGLFEARLHAELLPPPPTRKSQWLLALLVLRSGAELRRDWLAWLLWPNRPEAAALANLRNCLKDLRRSLGPAAGRIQTLTARTLTLDLAGVEVDVVSFDRAVARKDGTSLEQAVALYRGPLLEDCAEEWIVPDRQCREQAYLSALETLAQAALAANELSAAERYLRRTVTVEPLRESAHRTLMQVLIAGGNHTAASQVYWELRRHLRRELNTEPDPETIAFFQQHRGRAGAGETRRAAPETARQDRGGIDPGAEIGTGPRSIGLAPSHLPVQPTPLVGRAREVTAVKDLLQREDLRLVTLTGPGGIGKTRLALRIAGELQDVYRHGVFFIDLAPIFDPELVASTIAYGLGFRSKPASRSATA